MRCLHATHDPTYFWVLCIIFVYNLFIYVYSFGRPNIIILKYDVSSVDIVLLTVYICVVYLCFIPSHIIYKENTNMGKKFWIHQVWINFEQLLDFNDDAKQ